jgi:hypothetical protein
MLFNSPPIKIDEAQTVTSWLCFEQYKYKSHTWKTQLLQYPLSKNYFTRDGRFSVMELNDTVRPWVCRAVWISSPGGKQDKKQNSIAREVHLLFEIIEHLEGKFYLLLVKATKFWQFKSKKIISRLPCKRFFHVNFSIFIPSPEVRLN